MKTASLGWILLICIALIACSNEDKANTPDGDTVDGDSTDNEAIDGDGESELSGGDEDNVENESDEEDAPRVGFEILQVLSMNEIVVWISTEITQEEFNAIDAPPMEWIKNEPREGDPDGAFFARSPDSTVDGEFTYEEHFGHEWMHNATVIEANTPLDDNGLLRLSRVAKFHTVTFNAGRTLKVLVSPDGEQYVRISRDAGRTVEEPTLPEGWAIVDYVTNEKLSFMLPNPTDNIRCNNEDSFQGPLPELPLGE